jgi:hypothetical protein
MVTLEDVARVALALPETVESTSYGNPAWKVKGKAFVWERPFSKADVQAWGEGPLPEGPILGAYVEDLGEKEAVLAADTEALFTIPHFEGFSAVLVRLERIELARLEEIVVDAWLARAPQHLARDFLGRRGS